MAELEHIICFIFESKHAGLTPAEFMKVKIEQCEVFNIVKARARRVGRVLMPMRQSCVKEAAVDKRQEEKQNLARDEQELQQKGKFLSIEQQMMLDDKALAFLSQPTPAAVLVQDALDYQGHLIVHWLAGAVCPVFRSEVFMTLELRSSLYLDAATGCFIIDVRRPALHCRV